MYQNMASKLKLPQHAPLRELVQFELEQGVVG